MEGDGDKIDDVYVEEASVLSIAPEVVAKKGAREEPKAEIAEEEREKVQEELKMHEEVEVHESVEEEVLCAQEDVKAQEEVLEEVQEEVKLQEVVEVQEIAEKEGSKTTEGAEAKEQEEARVQENVKVKVQEEVKVSDKSEVITRESEDITETIVGKKQITTNQNPIPASKRASITRSVLARTPIAKKLEPQRTQRATPSKDTQGSLRPTTPVKAKIATPVLRNTTNTAKTAIIGLTPKVCRLAFGTSTTWAQVPSNNPRNAVVQASSVVRSPITKRALAVPTKETNSQPKNSSFRPYTSSGPLTPPKAAATSNLQSSKVTMTVATRPIPSKPATAKKVTACVPAPVMKSSAPAKVLAAASVLKTVVISSSIKARLSTAGKSTVKTLPRISTKNITG